jgi:membrane protease YdiL (CAAX protease family)
MTFLDAPSAHGSPAAGDRLARSLHGFGPIGVLAVVIIFFAGSVSVPIAGQRVLIPFGGLLVLAWTRLTGTPWREIGFVRPESWSRSLAVGVGFGIAFKLLMKSIVMPLLGADPINHAYHFLTGNRPALLAMIISVIFSAGFGEETFFRGFLFERLGKLLGPRAWTKPVTVALTSILFGLAHYADQGLAGAQQAMIVGVVFGTIYAKTGRLWMLMCAHAAFDLTALSIIYWDLETAVARLIFR